MNGKAQTVKLPKTAAWGSFPENSVAMIPATLKRGGNFIEVEPDQNFAELDRIDFLRVIRDTIPGNGFDNGIKVRLTNDDKLAVKNGGYAIFENVVTDSIKSTEVKVELQQCSGGTLSIREGSASGTELSKCTVPTELSKCTVPSSCASGAWTEVNCSATKKLSGIKDFYLTGSGMSGEVLVGNIRFGKIAEPAVSSSSVNPPASSSSMVPPASSSSEIAPESSSSGTTAIAPRVIRNDVQTPARKGYRDLKGRSFDKQIPYRVMF